MLGDFFFYLDKSNVYWSGYFIIRLYVKKFSREVERNFYVVDILNILVIGYSKKWNVEYLVYYDILNFL